MREQRDLAIEKLRKKYAPKIARLQERVEKAEDKVDKEEEQFSEARRSSWASMGSSILGALFGRKVASATNARRGGSVAKSFSRASKEKGDIKRAERELEAKEEELRALEAEFQAEVDQLEERIDPLDVELTAKKIRPRKSDIAVEEPALVWRPFCVDKNGVAEPGCDW